MITIKAPSGRSFYQVIDFGTVNYTYPSAFSSENIDEILIGDSNQNDGNQINFVKRYNTWILFTIINNPPPGDRNRYNIILLNYDNNNQIAYTANETISILSTP
jgi:hypothetical protein